MNANQWAAYAQQLETVILAATRLLGEIDRRRALALRDMVPYPQEDLASDLRRVLCALKGIPAASMEDRP